MIDVEVVEATSGGPAWALYGQFIQSQLGHAAIAAAMHTHGKLLPDAADHGRGRLEAKVRVAGVTSGAVVRANVQVRRWWGGRVGL